jgi:hypothetical protein
MYNSLGSGGSGEHETGPTSTQSEYANLYDLRTYSSTSNPLPADKIYEILKLKTYSYQGKLF